MLGRYQKDPPLNGNDVCDFPHSPLKEATRVDCRHYPDLQTRLHLLMCQLKNKRFLNK